VVALIDKFNLITSSTLSVIIKELLDLRILFASSIVFPIKLISLTFIISFPRFKPEWSAGELGTMLTMRIPPSMALLVLTLAPSPSFPLRFICILFVL
jgi:hypothetical protein